MTTQLQTLMKSLTRDSSLKKNVVLSLLEEEEREFKQIETELKNKLGSINEAGYLESLYKKGFNELKSILELVANCIDAESTEIEFSVEEKNTYMTDNGKGMDEDDMKNMMDVQRENHKSDISLGVSGVGGKIATLYLGNKEEVIYYSHKQDGPYLKLTIPWKDIFKKQIYTGMSECEYMNDDEKKKFEEKTTNNTGTMIEFKSSKVLTNTLLENFKTKIIKYDEDMQKSFRLTDSAPIVFGRFSELKITYKNYEDAEDIKTMKKYDYFSDEETEYYLGKQEFTIEGWKLKQGNQVRYIYTDEIKNQWEIVAKGRGWSKKAIKNFSNLTKYELFGKWDIYVGLRKDKSTFDPDNPCTLKDLEKKYKYAQNHFHNEYDQKYLVENLTQPNFAYINQWPLVRNGQEIGRIPCPDFAASSARGSLETYVTYMTRVDIRYQPTSNQSNFQDKQMGIQENKNQFESGDIPLNFSRLVKHVRELQANKILKYMKGKVKTPGGGGETKKCERTGPTKRKQVVGKTKGDVDAVAPKTGASKTGKETLKEPENKVKRPSNVSAHRKGSVTRKEIMKEWEKATKNMTDNEEYSGKNYLNLYNLLVKINNLNE